VQQRSSSKEGPEPPALVKVAEHSHTLPETACCLAASSLCLARERHPRTPRPHSLAGCVSNLRSVRARPRAERTAAVLYRTAPSGPSLEAGPALCWSICGPLARIAAGDDAAGLWPGAHKPILCELACSRWIGLLDLSTGVFFECARLCMRPAAYLPD
jgi:hypothetical protein